MAKTDISGSIDTTTTVSIGNGEPPMRTEEFVKILKEAEFKLQTSKETAIKSNYSFFLDEGHAYKPRYVMKKSKYVNPEEEPGDEYDNEERYDEEKCNFEILDNEGNRILYFDDDNNLQVIDDKKEEIIFSIIRDHINFNNKLSPEVNLLKSMLTKNHYFLTELKSSLEKLNTDNKLNDTIQEVEKRLQEITDSYI